MISSWFLPTPPSRRFLLGVTDITVPWETLLLSVALYVVLPLLAGYLTRQHLHERIGPVVDKLKPWSVIGLLATVTLLFGFQAETILQQPQTISPDCNTADTAELRHLFYRLCGCQVPSPAPQYRRPGCPDRHQ